MKRSAKIYMVLLVWIAAALQFFINKKMDIEEVFAGVQEADAQMQIDADVSAWGVYQVAHSHLTPTAIKNLLLNTAEYFCLTSGELTVTGQDEYITTFQSNGESELWRITFLVDSNTGQSYLIFHTDNIEAVDRIHTFYDDLNIDEVVSVEADISLQPSGKDPLLEKLLAELPVTGLTQTPEGWYGRLNSNVHLSDLAANKNVRIQETGYGSVHLQFGDKTDLVRLYASVLTQ
ncbi:Uncharacterised protein [uncultured Coprococcus sp.]|jgi:hypothetical protein|uniref:hypothetical protein n=1 Tax=Coprococcus ammoniilyticus TaxID=2981785 RepID=UPI000820767B|nr:hypothetical protein [Coprococcus ammoniilyticus]MCU6731202.1 hypothetical protein [Coprococcus ammoniilyticus]RHV79096.1 hypothetical protein DXB01_08045 [Clostridium sp. OF10-22XD]SCI03946.1 Uncharacterised protein [uncultured Coprococcus sp.]